MKWSPVKVVRNTLLALSVGVLLPSLVSACSLTPGEKPKGDNMSGDQVTIASSDEFMMNSHDWPMVVPHGHAWGLHKHGWKSLESSWTGDNDADDDDSGATSVASNMGTSESSSNDTVTTSDDSPTTPTPEPSTLSLLGLGTIALGFAFGGRRLRSAVE